LTAVSNASGTEAEGRDIARALATLVEEQRAVLLLVMLEGLSYREVADIQGVPIGTVMSRLHRARQQLQKDLFAYAVESGIVGGGLNRRS